MRESNFIMLTILSAIMVSSGYLLANSMKEGIIAQNVKALSSHDKNARREAMEAIFRESKINRWEVSLSQVDREEIRRHMLRWDENSDKAALILGQLRDEESVSSIRQVMKEARRIQSKKDPMDDRNVLAPRMELACLTALLVLNDADAIQDVKQLLKEDTIASRYRAIGCIQSAEKAELIPELLPLLNDTRDAVNIAPSGGEYYLRVCDVAINAIDAISKVNVSFTIQHGKRYNEQMISEFRTNIRNWLAEQSVVKGATTNAISDQEELEMLTERMKKKGFVCGTNGVCSKSSITIKELKAVLGGTDLKKIKRAPSSCLGSPVYILKVKGAYCIIRPSDSVAAMSDDRTVVSVTVNTKTKNVKDYKHLTRKLTPAQKQKEKKKK